MVQMATQEINWKITHRPDPEFDGYPWHGPAGTDPCQYHIHLKPEHLDPNAPVWVMWPSGEVYTMWNGEPEQIGEAMEMEEDLEHHSWMFSGLSWDEQMYIGRTKKGAELLTYFHLIRDELDTIITDSVHDWPQDEPKETGETCVWCEHNTAEIIDEVWNDTRMDDCDTATYQVVKCTTCGAEYHIGKKFTSFVTYTKEGKPELSVECGCFNCKWSEESPIIGMDGIACAGCDTEPNGQLTHDDPTAKSNWEPMERKWGE